VFFKTVFFGGEVVLGDVLNCNVSGSRRQAAAAAEFGELCKVSSREKFEGVGYIPVVVDFGTLLFGGEVALRNVLKCNFSGSRRQAAAAATYL
jgi:hypothetical protein